MMKRLCIKCKEEKPLSEFGKNNGYKDGISGICKTCKAEKDRRNYQKRKHIYAEHRARRRADKKKVLADKRTSQAWKDKNARQLMVYAAKKSADKRGLEFSITKEDIFIPEFCPLLGVRLERGIENNRDFSPSLDRKDSRIGYIPENVWVISYRANRIKNNASLEELQMLTKNLEINERSNFHIPGQNPHPLYQGKVG